MKQKTRGGVLLEGTDGQEKLLGLLYGSALGRLILKPLTAPAVSRLAGALLSTPVSKVLIGPFVRKNNIDMAQYLPGPYHSYNEFFARYIRPELRPVDTDPRHFVSPCDSKLTVLPVTRDGRFTIKHTQYTVTSLLKDEALASRYDGGQLLIFRLTVDDYHRYCYPADGSVTERKQIPGMLHTVNPIANDYFPIYKENSREYTCMDTPQFGQLVMMEVGALLVGKIVNHPLSDTVHRGQEKGYFQFGGSTVIVLLERDKVLIDADILGNSRDTIETVVKYGEKIGVSI